MDEDDFYGGYEDYEPSPNNGDDIDGVDLDDFYYEDDADIDEPYEDWYGEDLYEEDF